MDYVSLREAAQHNVQGNKQPVGLDRLDWMVTSAACAAG